MDVFTLMAKIGLDTSEYDQNLSTAGSKFQSFGSAMVSGAGAIVNGIGAGLTAATGALVAFGGASVKTGMSFDSSMAQVAATMGVTVDEISELRDYAQQMGATTAFSATEAADALNYMALAGYDAETSMSMLPNVLNLAAAGGIDLAYASDMITDSQSALGLSLEQTSDLVDQMAMASSKSNTSVAQLGEAMLTIGATARNVKGGTQELSTLLGVLADNGIKGAEGGTHLRNMILSLQNPTDKGAAALKQLGVATYDADGNMRSMIDIVADLQNGLNGMDQASQDTLLNGIFNKTDLAAVNAMLGTSSERFDELSGAISDAQGAAQKMADTQLDNLQGDITILKSAFEGAQIALSDKLTPSFRDFVQMGTNGLTALTDALKTGDVAGAVDAISNIFLEALHKLQTILPAAVKTGAEVLKSIIKGIASNAKDIVKSAADILETFVKTVVELIPDVLPDIIIAVAEVLPDLVMSIVDIIASSVPAFVEAGKKLFDAIPEGFFESLPEMVSKGTQVIAEFIQDIGEKAPEFINVGMGFVTHIVNGLLKGLPTAISAIGTIAVSIIKAFLDNAPEFYQAAYEGLFAMARGILASLPDILAAILQIVAELINVIIHTDWITLGVTIITTIAEGIKSLFDMIPGLLVEIATVAWNFVKEIDWPGLGMAIITLIWEMLNALFFNIPNKLLEIGKSAWEKFRAINWKDLGLYLINYIVNAMASVFGKIGNKLVEIGKDAWERFKNINWIDLGMHMVDGIVEGIKKFGSRLITAVLDMCGNAYDAILDFFDISSPSKLMRDQVGKFIPLGMAEGIEDYAYAVEGAMDSLSIVPSTSNIGVSGSYGSNGNAGGNFGDIVINITSNGNARDIAEEVSQRLAAEYNRRKAVWQTA